MEGGEGGALFSEMVGEHRANVTNIFVVNFNRKNCTSH